MSSGIPPKHRLAEAASGVKPDPDIARGVNLSIDGDENVKHDVDMSDLIELYTLIERVDRNETDPLTKITKAEELSAELDRLGDRLVGYFIEQARAAGHSWSDIGAHLGMSRQAAQQRYTPRQSALTMDDVLHGGAFKGLVPRARTAVTDAVEHARRLDHPAVRPTDLLLGVLGDPHALAVQMITRLGADPDTIRSGLRQTGDGAPVVIPVEPATRTALGKALSEAVGLGHNYIGTEHLLLGILNDPNSEASQALATAGVTLDAAREALRRIVEEIVRNRTE
ncbi:Clp protease N-terminal domain-containing protein [Microbispora sp. KK1-11]|uniref:Clp protease N-terminal domain-containing protein n=1 Tax=Microbispora sp. KK1-11 TaxID=2053005 RepID=UPI00115A299E|nr:Clp protease N-terminal domain-containing protein [Microbispora sp. KK1-11]TQS21404.1 ATP-dependent Clp protease ATP-binding subunit [Microbispora sp. KK1-11]